MTRGAPRARHVFAVACAFVLAGASFVLSPDAHAGPNQDAGVCTVHATLTFTNAIGTTPATDVPYQFDSGSETCTSALGSYMSWQGGGQALTASCSELVDLLMSADVDTVYFGVTTTGTGNLAAQQWVFQSEEPSFTWTATGSFVPDPSVYGNPAAPTQQCAGGGFTTIYLLGVVQYAYQTKIGT